MGDREHDEVVEDPAIGPPVPAVGGGIGLAPRLGRLERHQPVGGGDDLVRRALMPDDRHVQRAGGSHPVEVEAVEPKGVGGEHPA